MTWITDRVLAIALSGDTPRGAMKRAGGVALAFAVFFAWAWYGTHGGQ